MYQTPPPSSSRSSRIRRTSASGNRTPRQQQHVVDDGPIADLKILIETTTGEDWQRRVEGLEQLVDKIPDGSQYLESGSLWYNTPKTIWHLYFPISELLRDPRSTVIRRVCFCLVKLFNKCQSDARLLFKDLMSTILQVQAATVQINRLSVQNMVLQAIPEVPCKSVMPLWMEKLKDKSPSVRDACSLYLGLALRSWTDDGYLTNDIWNQVGQCLLKTLRDPSPTVRKHAKSALAYMKLTHSDKYDTLINDPHGPAAKDPKLLRWLRSLGENNDLEELSVASRYTFNSVGGGGGGRGNSNAMRISSPRVRLTASNEEDEDNVPISIQVTHKMRSSPAPSPGNQQASSRSTGLSGQPPPPMMRPKQAPPPSTPIGTPPRPPSSSGGGGMVVKPSPRVATYSALAQQASSAATTPAPSSPGATTIATTTAQPVNGQQQPLTPLEYSESSHTTEDMMHGVGSSTLPVIASKNELLKHASQRRSRNAILMQERFRMTNSSSQLNMDDEKNGGGSENSIPNSGGGSTNSTNHGASSPKPPPTASTTEAAAETPAAAATAPEHIVIAIRLLRAHKTHVDQIMETLKIEMDTLRDFDKLLEEPGRPTEQELLNYYESVDLCLEQRLTAGLDLRKEMDRISNGSAGE